MRHSMLSAPLCILLCTSAAHAQWTENFDTYTSGGAAISPQSTWEDWSAGAEGWVESGTVLSGANSVTIGQARGGTSTLETDIIHRYYNPLSPGTYDNGLWVYSAWQYIPSSMTGTTYFIILNTYNTGGPYNWSVQVEFDAVTGDVEGDCGASNNWNVDLVADQWVQIRAIIDLDNDEVQVFYDNGDPTNFGSPIYQWTGGVFGQGGGQLAIGAVDLYGNSGTDCYYDDLSLQLLSYEKVGHNPAGSQGNIVFTQLIPASASVGAWATTYDGMPSAAHFHILGLQRSFYSAGALPLDLGFVGMPGFYAHVADDAILFQLGTASGPNTFSGAFSMSIPSGPAFVGTNLNQQVFYLDPGANALGAGMSDAMFTRITL